MMLATELKELGIRCSCKEFKQTIFSTFIRMHDEWSEDDLVCHPDNAMQFCDEIRKDLPARLTDDLILHTLLNRRKQGGGGAVGSRRKGQFRLAELLKDHDVRLSPREFREELAELHALHFGSWTEDDLVCHPSEAKQFCSTVRAKFGSSLPDHVILRTLLNRRKKGSGRTGSRAA